MIKSIAMISPRRSFLSAFCVAGIVAVCLVMPPLSVSALAQDVDSRLQRIENEIQTLSRAVFRGEQPPEGTIDFGGASGAAANASIELRLQQIEMELRNLTGQVEQQGFRVRQYEDRTERMLIDMEARLGVLETQRLPAQMGAAGIPNSVTQNDIQENVPGNRPFATTQMDTAQTSTLNPPSASVNVNGGFDTTAISGNTNNDMDLNGTSANGQLGTLRQPVGAALPDGAQVIGIEPVLGAGIQAGEPAVMYERAFSFLRDRDYTNAESAFDAFLKRYPGHDLAGNAQYWLGETFYVRNDFERAARVFAEAYQKYPDGPKGPDNLLKLGMALAGLQKTDDACVTFAQLQKEYPTSAAPIQVRAEKEMEKLGCSQF